MDEVDRRIVGWSYVDVNEPSAIVWATCFLSDYRRELSINSGLLDEMRSSAGRFAGMSIADAEHAIGTHPQPLV